METDFSLLKQLFCIHSKSGKEGKMRKFIWNWIKQNVPSASVTCDKPGNLYVTKGESETYPCIVAHLDQVQERHAKDFKAYEAEDIIIGFSSRHCEQQGLGADDKCGIWVGLKCLQEFDAIKLAFFVGEEIGCKGSSAADMEFFTDCRFVIEPDRRGHKDIITQIGWQQLCSEEFLQDTGYEDFGYEVTDGLMTDIEALKENGLGVSCINLSCGYYKPHTDQEFVYKPALLNCLDLVRHIIGTCTKVYTHIDNDSLYDNWEQYYGDYYDEVYDLMATYPGLDFGDVEILMEERHGVINRDELLAAYDFVRDDIAFWHEQQEKETTKVLT